jgi:hypothetical protein
MKVVTEHLKFADLFPEEAGKLAQKLHIKKDEIPFVRKSYVSDKQEVLKGERAVISYISTNIKDRDGEQLVPDGVKLENYRKNPIVLYGHDYRSVPIGKNIWIKKEGNGLKAKTVFAKSEFADQIYKAYTDDIEGTGPLLKGWSVGFIPIKWDEPKEKDEEKKADLPKRIYTKWELLEYSAVAIPSCPEALTLAVEKDLIPDRIKEDLELDIEIKDFQKDEDMEITIEGEREISIDKDDSTIAETKEEIEENDLVIADELVQKVGEEDLEEEKEVVLLDGLDQEVPSEEVELDETEKILNSPELMESLKRAEEDIKAGRVLTHDEVFDEPDDHADIKEAVFIALDDLKDQIAELKEGRVLSRKNRSVVKDAITALKKVLEADSAGSREDEEENVERDITIDEVDIEGKVEEKTKEAIVKAIQKAISKENIEEAVKLQINKIKGKIE